MVSSPPSPLPAVAVAGLVSSSAVGFPWFWHRPSWNFEGFFCGLGFVLRSVDWICIRGESTDMGELMNWE